MSEHVLSDEEEARRRGLDFHPVQVRSGPALCALRVWTEEEWAALPPARRPAAHAHAPGLGWVGAVPRLFLN